MKHTVGYMKPHENITLFTKNSTVCDTDCIFFFCALNS